MLKYRKGKLTFKTQKKIIPDYYLIELTYNLYELEKYRGLKLYG